MALEVADVVVGVGAAGAAGGAVDATGGGAVAANFTLASSAYGVDKLFPGTEQLPACSSRRLDRAGSRLGGEPSSSLSS